MTYSDKRNSFSFRRSRGGKQSSFYLIILRGVKGGKVVDASGTVEAARMKYIEECCRIADAVCLGVIERAGLSQ